MEHYANRPAQPHQTHVYSTSPYNVYSGQQAYLTGPYQAMPQHHTITFQQGPSHYTRPTVGNAQIATSIPQRRVNEVVNGVNRSAAGLQQASVPSASIAQQYAIQQHTTNASGDAPNSIASLAASITQHHRIAATQEMPLRIVVDAKYVGAIIGQGGSKIREITRESRARCVVDTQRALRDSLGNAEKVISILGQPESCSKACMKILEIVRREMEKDYPLGQLPEIELRIRVHNQLVGRLIGRGGATIRRLMEETGAHIYVSNEPSYTRESFGVVQAYSTPVYNDLPTQLQSDRTVTVKAPEMSSIAAAEQKISQKLRQSYESDLTSRIMYPSTATNSSNLPMITSIGDPSYLSTSSVSPARYIRGGNASASVAQSSQQNRTVHMRVPNNIVGALIGSKGINIRAAMRMTGAQLRIEGGPTNKEKKEKSETNEETDEHKISNSTENKETKKNSEGNESDSASKDGQMVEREHEKDENALKVNLPKSKDSHIDERLVTIIGSDQQQYKAQSWVYQRIAEQSNQYADELRLCTDIIVPSKLVGRIIGKGGQNVRELQRFSGAQVKIPDDGVTEDELQRKTVVRVTGTFQASQAVQSRIGHLINDFAQRLQIGPSNGQGASNTQGSSPGLQNLSGDGNRSAALF